MAKPRKRKPGNTEQLVTIDEFKIQFVKTLNNSYRKDKTISFILDKERELCSTLMWLCVNDCAGKLSKLSRERRERLDRLISKIQAGIRGLEGLTSVYRDAYPNPLLQQCIAALMGDLLAKEALLTSAPVPINHGINGDWGIVAYAKETLENAVDRKISYGTLSRLLNAAYFAIGENREHTEDSVRRGLSRHQQRNDDRFKPAVERVLKLG